METTSEQQNMTAGEKYDNLKSLEASLQKKQKRLRTAADFIRGNGPIGITMLSVATITAAVVSTVAAAPIVISAGVAGLVAGAFGGKTLHEKVLGKIADKIEAKRAQSDTQLRNAQSGILEILEKTAIPDLVNSDNFAEMAKTPVLHSRLKEAYKMSEEMKSSFNNGGKISEVQLSIAEIHQKIETRKKQFPPRELK